MAKKKPLKKAAKKAASKKASKFVLPAQKRTGYKSKSTGASGLSLFSTEKAQHILPVSSIKRHKEGVIHTLDTKMPPAITEPHFTIKYGGTSKLDIDTLIGSLENVKKGLEQISWESNGEPVKIAVTPFQVGSFEWVVALMDPSITTQASLLANYLPGKDIIEKFKNIVKLVTFLKGEKPKSEEETNKGIKITNKDGKVKVVGRDEIGVIYNNDGPVNHGAVFHVENLIVLAGNDNAVDSLQFLDDKLKSLIRIPKKTLRAASDNIVARRHAAGISTPQATKEVTKNNVHVATSKPDLAGNSLWNVVYEGHQIKIKVEDQEFLVDVNKGKHAFANGTLLKVDMVITQVYDEKINTYVNKGYSLKKFHSIVQPAEQSKMDL